jgi:uncharacterized protein YtpQ (UPF0354 family)
MIQNAKNGRRICDDRFQDSPAGDDFAGLSANGGYLTSRILT